MGKARAASFPIKCDTTHACGRYPSHASHVTRAHTTPTSRTQCGSWGSATSEGVTAVQTLPRVPVHRSGPGPTTLRAYVWPRPGGSCRCTKVGAFLYPFTCARAVVATPVAVLGEAEEAKVRDCQGSTQARGAKSKGARWASPGKCLAGAAYVAPAKALLGQIAQHQQDRHP